MSATEYRCGTCGTQLDIGYLIEAAEAVLRVRNLADEWEGWARVRSTPRIDAFRDAAEQIRAALTRPAERVGQATTEEDQCDA